MSSYISGLLDRTLGDAPLLRPRTPSRYEPAPAEPEPAALAPPAAERVITRTVEQRVVEPGEVHERQVERERVVREAAAPVARERERIVVEERPSFVPVRPNVPSPPVETRRTPQTPKPIVPAPPAAPPAATPSEPPAPLRPMPLPEGPPPRRIDIHQHANTNITVQRPARRIETNTRVESQRIVETAPPQEPQIRVTIGRVDVRAVVRPDAQRPGAREPQGPRLSLDDYLRTRDGGRR